jgi:DNA-binding Xre family transcriptional regulator
MDITIKKTKKDKRKVTINNIKKILEESGMSQQELSDISGISTPHLSRIINGQRKCISLPIALKISKALKHKVEDVFCE